MIEFGLLVGLVGGIAAFAALGRRLSIPDPIAFALGGIALAVIPGIPRVAMPPNLVLVVFLPALVYAAAQSTSWSELRREAYPILVLAVGLVLVTMCAVAVVARAVVPEITWAAAFTLGAIVAPPDTVAAKSISDTLRLPRRLASILDGEGLVNDATALVAFQLASGIAITGAVFALPSATARLLYAAALSIGIGICVGWIGRLVLNQVNDPAVENTVTLILPFAVFLAAERLHASGVLAVLTLALYQSRFGVAESSSLSRLEGRVLWDMINFLLTGLSFVLVGLQLPSVVEGLSIRTSSLALAIAAVCLTVILIRPLWVFGVAWLSHGVMTGLGESIAPSNRPPRGVLAVISWAGMRGVISLALALSLPLTTVSGAPFPQRNLIVVITFAVVLVTLLGQGLTLPFLIRVLKVRSIVERVDDQEYAVQLRMARAALDRLDSIARETKVGTAAVERVRGFYADRISRLARGHDVALGTPTEQAHAAKVDVAAEDLLGKLLEVEHHELRALRDAGSIEAHLARQIQARLDALRHLDRR